jgi:hypothetical protein
MTTAFVRQLGAESGVQLNPLRDNSEIPTQDNADQVFGIMMRSTRGRIDKPFKVNRGNVANLLGRGEQMRVSALNEAWVHVVEALNNGAYEAVIQRLVTSAAAISYGVAFQGSGLVLGTVTVSAGAVTTIAVTNGGTGYGVAPDIIISGMGTGATATATVVAGVVTAIVVVGGAGYTVAPTATVTIGPKFAVYNQAAFDALTIPYLFAVKHLECFNDGIKINFRAEEYRVAGANVANSKITLVITDVAGLALYEFTGSLVAGSLDDYGNSNFLTDIVAGQSDAVEVTVGTITSVPVTSNAYGYNATTGQTNWAKSATLVCFSEGGTAYATSDYMAAHDKLQFTPFNYAYISSGGTQAAALLAQLAQLAFDTNRQLRFDIPGNLTIAAAITFVEQLNMGASLTAHLMHGFYSPLKSDDPTGVNGKGFYGVATLNIAYACLRNAQTNAKGFAPKNYPIAGRQWPIRRTGITQAYTPRNQELNALARAKINPCLFETYTGGGRYVFRDSLTSALVESSLKKLIAVADMSTSIDDAVTRFGKDVLQLPMDVAVKRTKDFLKYLFEGAQAAGWIVPSSDPSMNGAAFQFNVKPNEVRPYDRMDVDFWLFYVGTVRQIFVQQTLSK